MQRSLVFAVTYDGGTDYVPYLVTEDEVCMVEQAKSAGIAFCNCVALQDLYARVLEAAQDMLLADFEEEGESVDIDALHLVIGF